jgi:heterogeneous nuclear ribonucleoprotein F/H
MPVVKLRGLPFSCGPDEINLFLEVETVDIVLVKRQGRFSGEAFVVLPGMMQVEFALNKHKAYMGKRYVEVQQASKEDYYRAIAEFVEDWSHAGGPPPSRGNDGLNRSAPPGFRGPPANNGMGGPPDGGMDMQKGPGVGGRGGPRYQGDSGRPYEREGPVVPGPLPTTGILRLRGLPFGASREDVADWFNDSGVLLQPINASNVHLVLAFDGRPTGSAFAEFSGPGDAESAMVRDKAMMGSRYVELFNSSREELASATGGAA